MEVIMSSRGVEGPKEPIEQPDPLKLAESLKKLAKYEGSFRGHIWKQAKGGLNTLISNIKELRPTSTARQETKKAPKVTDINAHINDLSKAIESNEGSLTLDSLKRIQHILDQVLSEVRHQNRHDKLPRNFDDLREKVDTMIKGYAVNADQIAAEQKKLGNDKIKKQINDQLSKLKEMIAKDKERIKNPKDKELFKVHLKAFLDADNLYASRHPVLDRADAALRSIRDYNAEATNKLYGYTTVMLEKLIGDWGQA